jgi:hypothetical protein
MIRLQLRLSDTAENLFNAMKKALGTAPKDVILDALALLHFAINEVRKGREIGSYDPAKREFTAWTTASLEGVKAQEKIAVAEAAPARATY